MGEISWIKLSVNIFDDEKIKLIRSMPEGDSMLLVWIQLLCLAGKTNDGGAIYMGQNMYYTDEMLATLCNQPLNIIRIAIKTFEQFGMIELDNNGLIQIENWEKHQNIEGMEKIREQNRIRKRRQREREKLKELNDSHVMSRDSHATDIDKDIDIDIDIDKIYNNKDFQENKNLTKEEKITINYYYESVKNNTKKNDYNYVVEAIKTYGYKRVLYVLYYLKEVQKSSISSFKYVSTAIKTMRLPDSRTVDVIVRKTLDKFKEA